MFARSAEEKSREKMWTSFFVDLSIRDNIQSMRPCSKNTAIVSSLIEIF
jgi:hypothetical protein